MPMPCFSHSLDDSYELGAGKRAVIFHVKQREDDVHLCVLKWPACNLLGRPLQRVHGYITQAYDVPAVMSLGVAVANELVKQVRAAATGSGTEVVH